MNRTSPESSDPTTPRFDRVLRSRDVIVLAFGAMIGWSWVLMTGLWVIEAGSLGTLIAFALGGGVIALIGLTYSELVAALPRAGGEHVYTHRGLGPGWSFLCTWALLLAYVNVCLFEAVALPTAVSYLVPQLSLGTLWTAFGAEVDLGFVLVGAGASALITLINVLGIRPAAWFQTVTFALIVVAGTVLLTGALASGDLGHARPLIATPATGILTVLIMVPALLVGFDVIPQSAEEINLPPRRIGVLLVVSVFLAVIWYGLISFSVAVALPRDVLADSAMASGDAAAALWGHPAAGSLLVIGGIAGILTSWNAFVIGGSRLLYALAGSGMVPAVFGRLHPRFHTPYVGIICIGVLASAAPLFGRTVLVWLVNAGSFATIVAYLFVPIAFLALRAREPELPRPFAVRGARIVGIGAVLSALALICLYLPGSPSALAWPYEWATIAVWSVLGAVLYARYRVRQRAVDHDAAHPTVAGQP